MGFQITNYMLEKYYEDPGVTEVIIPSGVKTIQNAAFQACKNIKKVIIPEGVISIGDLAFENCTSLESLSIPDSVSRIGTVRLGVALVL